MAENDDPLGPGAPPPDLPNDPHSSLRPPSVQTWAPMDPGLFSTALRDAAVAGDIKVEPGDPNAFLLRKEIGSGTFGEVWEAVQVVLNRVVAVKRPKPPEGTTEAEREDASRLAQLIFRQEALTTGHLDHPNIVPVYDLGAGADGRPLLAMKLVEGVPWDQKLREDENVALAERLNRHLPILQRVARAVAFSHARGIVHRDLKPGQVMVGNYGEVFLMDWGLAMSMPGLEIAEGLPATMFATPRDVAPNPAGTVAYMAPEQTRRSSDRLGPWTDVYLLGGMLYQILTGTAPHNQARSADAFQHAARGAVEPPEARSPGQAIPRELSDLCMRALAPETAQRTQTAEDFLESVEAWLSGATRREESRALATQARKALETAATGYHEIEQADALIVQALQNWADNPEARELQGEILSRFVWAALGNGDLKLARVQAERIAQPELRENMRAQVGTAERRARRHARQRRIALVASLLLLIAVAVAAVIYRSNAEAIRVQREQAQQKKELIWADVDTLYAQLNQEWEQETHSRILRDLRDATTSFINRVAAELPYSTDPRPTDDWLFVLLSARPELARDLATSRTEIAELRRQALADGSTIGEEPYELKLTEGLLKMSDPRTTAGLLIARDNFEEISTRFANRFEFWTMLAVVCSRIGDFPAARNAVDRAMDAVKLANGEWFTNIVFLRANLYGMADHAEKLRPGDVLIDVNSEMAETSGPRRYREIAGEWRTVRDGATRSFGTFLDPFRSRDARVMRFYGPFEKKIFAPLPARARFYPNLTTSGHYTVYTIWPSNGNAWPVNYHIHHAGGETSVSLVYDGFGIEGPPNSNLWTPLGEYQFLAGSENYVEVEVPANVKPLTWARQGDVIPDAMLFAARPLTVKTGTPRLAPPSLPSTVTEDNGTVPAQLLFENSLEEAIRRAGTAKLGIVAMVYHPASAMFIHPLNENRNYVDNRLFNNNITVPILQKDYVVARISLMEHPETVKKLGAPDATTSLFILGPDGSVRKMLTGKELLISPPEFREMLESLKAAP
ncbi:MAG: protein kinase [Candidatus Sumerlaeaceae bacterium]|nr:protein kinase [Candidatus Sumerlaeaceae bacterium]